jgi:hypothetical protein
MTVIPDLRRTNAECKPRNMGNGESLNGRVGKNNKILRTEISRLRRYDSERSAASGTENQANWPLAKAASSAAVRRTPVPSVAPITPVPSSSGNPAR